MGVWIFRGETQIIISIESESFWITNNNRVYCLLLSLRQDLRRLSLSNNLIEKLAARDFLGLAKLKYLDLSDNPLADLPPDVFRDIPVWQTLIQLIEIEFIVYSVHGGAGGRCYNFMAYAFRIDN